MALYKKETFIGGAWVRGSEIVSGTKCKLVAETEPQPSQFKNKDGSVKMRDVSKVKFDGLNDTLNINLNRATINGLVDAFGEDSKNWMNKSLTAITEKVMVGGKRVVAVYLLAEGYEMQDDENGYVKIVNPKKESVQVAPEDNGEVRTEDIPF